MICPVCGEKELMHGTHAVPYSYKGSSTSFQIVGDKCPACGEIILSKPECGELDRLMGDFERSVDADISVPAFLLAVRKKLGLNQKQAGELFGGGANAFSRYELGKAKPPRSLLQLFLLLDNDPSRLKELEKHLV